jgi:hypothetical protein
LLKYWLVTFSASAAKSGIPPKEAIRSVGMGRDTTDKHVNKKLVAQTSALRIPQRCADAMAPAAVHTEHTVSLTQCISSVTSHRKTTR